MSAGPVFVDTNVFAYALDDAEPRKQQIARRTIDERRRDIVVSTQVLFELHAVCTRKLGMSRDEARAAVEAVSLFTVTGADLALARDAAALAAKAQLSVFDAAIVCSARRAGCPTLLTEDLSAGQTFGDLVLENPFA